MRWTDNLDLFAAALLFALFAGLFCDMALRRYLKREDLPHTAHITVAVAAAFLCHSKNKPPALQVEEGSLD